jgi:anti-sigma factor RsiW
MSCPDANKIIAFTDGLLPEEDRLAVAIHLDGCELCLAVVTAGARQSLLGEPPAAATSTPPTIQSSADAWLSS